jgi:hypothetical protein
LEGDKPISPPKSGPDEKFATGPVAASTHRMPAEQGIPPGGGPGNLNAIARDPLCLFLSWDFSDDQQRYYNSLSADKHLVVRAYCDSLAGSVVGENHLAADSRHWFLHVPEAAKTYYTAIGYYLPDGSWITVRSFGPVTTQPDRAARTGPVQFAYAPPINAPPSESTPVARSDFSLASEPRFTTAAVSAESVRPPSPFGAEFTGRMHETIRTPVTPERALPSPSWTENQENALAIIISSLVKREGLPGSLELLERLQRELLKQPALSLAELGMLLPSSAMVPEIRPGEAAALPSSLPPGAELPPKKGFWFNINAELIIYGATEPDAQVTIGGRRIRLRPDGSFSYRFALPDGAYELPVEATSADGSDMRRAELSFSRDTSYSGEVGAHSQDKSLRIPAPENVA